MKGHCTRALVVFVALVAAAVGCTSSPVVDGSGGSGGDAGTGGTDINRSTLSLELRSSAIDPLEPGEVTELSWTVQDATLCEASGGWAGRKAADNATEIVPVFRDTTYTLTCSDDQGNEVSESVEAFVSSRLMATVNVTPNPAPAGERALVTIVVSNPSSAALDNVQVDLTIPEHVEPLAPDDYQGGTCSDPENCGPGDVITWVIGTLQPGEVVTLLVFPKVTLDAPPGTTLAFDLTLSASEEPVVRKVSTSKEGGRLLAIGLEQSRSKAQPGDEMSYTLHYANRSGELLRNVAVDLELPPGTELQLSSRGGTLMEDGRVQWTFTELEDGEAGTLTSTVKVDPVLPDGAQLRAKAGGEVEGERTLATTHTALSQETLVSSGQTTPARVKANERMMAEVTTSNRGIATMEEVEVSVWMPLGIQPFSDSELSGNGSCPGEECTPGELATWTVGDLGAGESATVSFVPVASPSIDDGKFLTFDTLVKVGDKVALQTSGTSIEGERSLAVRVSESDNPVRRGDSLIYTLHIANQDDTAADGSVTLPIPTGSRFVGASNGGALTGNRVVEWSLKGLLPGAGTTRQLAVEMEPTLALGSQLRADTTASVDDESTRDGRAIRNTPVSETPLRASIAVTPDPTESNERIAVAVTVSNPSSGPADDVKLYLRIPQFLNAIPNSELSGNGECPGTGCGECPGTGCTAGETATWSLGSLAAGESTTVTLPPVVASGTADGTLISFNAEVRATDQVPVLASATTVVENARQLELQLTQSENPARPGATLVYTLHFGNQSDSTFNGTLVMNVPDGTRFLATSEEGLFIQKANADTSRVEWEVTDLGPGEGGTRELTVEVEPDLPLGSPLRAQASAETGDGAGDQARGVSNSTASEASLVASINVGPDPVAPGQAGSVSVVISNPTSAPVNDAVVAVRIPKHLDTIQNSQMSVGGACPGTGCTDGERASWLLGTLGPGESRTVSFSPVVAAGVPDGTLTFFEAEVNATDEVPVLARGTTLVNAQKALELLVQDGGYPVAPGATLLYIVHYGNRSDAPLDGTVTLSVPDGTSFESASDGGGLNSDGDAQWSIANLPPDGGDSHELTVTVDADLPEGSLVATSATATVGDGDGQSARATETTPAASGPLMASIGVAPDPVEPTGRLTVSATVTNTGVSTVNDIDVYIVVPPGLDPIVSSEPSDLSAGGSCPGISCSALQRAEWSVGDLSVGESSTVALTATVASDTAPGSLVSFVAEVAAADQLIAGASGTVSICGGATCPPPAAPNLMLYGDFVLAARFDSSFGGTPSLRLPLQEFANLSPAYPTFAPDGRLWFYEGRPGGLGDPVTGDIRVYDMSLGQLVSCARTGHTNGSSCDSPTGVLEGFWGVGPLAATHQAIYGMSIGFGPAVGTQYRLVRMNADASWDGILPVLGNACSSFGPTDQMAALPPDPNDLSKEELYAQLGSNITQEQERYIVKFGVNPPSCELVALMNGGNAVPAISNAMAPWMQRIRVASDGTIFFLLRRDESQLAPDDGIWRLADTDGDGDIDGTDQMTMIIEHNPSDDAQDYDILDFAIEPDEGLLYVNLGSHAPANVQPRVEVYEPTINLGDGPSGAFYLPTDYNGEGSIDFFPEN